MFGIEEAKKLIGEDTHKTGSYVSVINDPFMKDCLEGISIFCRKTYENEFVWSAWVKFKNGDTKGEQRIEDAKSIDEVLIKIKSILQTILKK